MHDMLIATLLLSMIVAPAFLALTSSEDKNIS